MCKSFANVLGCLALVAFGGFSVTAHAIPGVNVDTDSNKTDVAGDKAPNHIVGKSIRPVMVPYYPSFVAPPTVPLKYQRLQMPLVPSRVPLGYSINVPVVSNPHVTPYSGFQPPVQQMIPPVQQMIVQPMMPQFDAAFSRPILSRYLQQQPIMPPTYNLAPYASNTYASYAFRSADADEEDEAAQSVQYGTRYVSQPPEFEIDEPTKYVTDHSSLANFAYSSEGVEPRQALLMESDDDFVPLTGTTDQIFYELMNPSYVAEPNPEQQPEVRQLMRHGITNEPSPYISVTKPYIDLEGTSWIIPRGNYKVPLILKA